MFLSIVLILYELPCLLLLLLVGWHFISSYLMWPSFWHSPYQMKTSGHCWKCLIWCWSFLAHHWAQLNEGYCQELLNSFSLNWLLRSSTLFICSSTNLSSLIFIICSCFNTINWSETSIVSSFSASFLYWWTISSNLFMILKNFSFIDIMMAEYA